MAGDLRALLDQPPSVPFRYVKGLDGIRGLAILSVMFGHYSAGLSSWAPTRFFGVSLAIDLFFVLSGFLITSLLLEEWSTNRTVSLRNFYVRRGLRLLPALYTLLAVVLVLAVVTTVFPPHWLPIKLTIAEVGAAALYVYPLVLIVKGGNVFLLHLWTLSVEEWFYFLWPAFLIFGLRPGTSRRFKQVVGALAGFCAFCLVLRALGGHDGLTRLFAAFRPDSLFYGSLLAIGVRRVNEYPNQRLERVMAVAGPLGVFAFVWFSWFAKFPRLPGLTEVQFHDQAFRSWNYQLGILSTVLFVGHVVRRPESRFAGFLSWPPLVRIGLISYGLYLWHQPIFLLANGALHFNGDPNVAGFTHHSVAARWVFALLVVLGSFLAAWVSRKFVELPALRLKSRFEVVHFDEKR